MDNIPEETQTIMSESVAYSTMYNKSRLSGGRSRERYEGERIEEHELARLKYLIYTTIYSLLERISP